MEMKEADSMGEKSKTGLFSGLLLLCVVLFGLLVAVVLYMLFHLNTQAYQWILIALAAVAACFVLVMAAGLVATVLSMRRKKPLGGAGRFLLRRALSLYPLVLALGRLFGKSSSDIQNSFVDVNNKLVRASTHSVPAKNIVVLAPHCLQRSECAYRVTLDVSNCQGCGKCDISGLRELCLRLGVHLTVVTGGTLARSFIKEHRPQAVVAIACERDLSSGIMDVFPLPSLGVRNMRPEGPCINTRVALAQVEEAILFFMSEPAPDKPDS